METETKDAKPLETPSPSETVQTAESQPAAEPTAQPKEQTLADVAQKAFDAATETADEKPEEGRVLSEEPTEEKKPVEAKEEPSTVKPTELDPGDEKLPFHEHPRFKEVITQRNEFKTKAAEFETKVKELDPVIKQSQYDSEFRRTFNITEKQYADHMNIMALANTDPVKAREMLKPLWDSLQEADPNFIPADLTARVERGEINEDAAKEIARLRATSKNGERRHQLTVQEQAQQHQRSIYDTIISWNTAKASSDPDYKPRPASDTGPDGLYEVTAAKLAFLINMEPPQTPQAMAKLMERAYQSAKQLFTQRLAPPARASKTLSSTRSSVTSRREPKNIREVVAAAAAEHGIHYEPAEEES